MQWLSDLWTGDSRFVQLAVLAACGIAVLVLLAIIYRVVFAHRLRVPGGRTRQPRLGLVDAFSLDGQRQLVLVRRDNVEHLIMIGGPNDVLLESEINRVVATSRENGFASSGPASPARRRADPAAVTPVAAQPPAVATEALPPAPVAADLAEGRAALARLPVNTPAPVAPQPQRQPAPVATQPHAAAAGASLAPAADHAAPVSAHPATPTLVRRTMPPPIAPLGRATVSRFQENPAHPPQASQPAAAPASPTGPARPVEAAARPAEAAPHPSDAASLPGQRPLSQPPKADGAHGTEPPVLTARAQPAPHPGPYPHEAASAPKPMPRSTPVGGTPSTGPVPVAVHAPAASSAAATPTDVRAQFPRAEAPGSTPHPEPRAEPKTEARADVRVPAAPTHPHPNPPASPHRTAAPAAAASQPAEKPHAANDDPFAGLDSLEAEMAKLLGREKRN